MTRKEELVSIASQCWCDPRTSMIEMDTRLAEVFVEKLQQVEREVLSRCQDKIESLMEKENESTDDQVWEYRDWLKEQQKELG